jgi:hypothetical protein
MRLAVLVFWSIVMLLPVLGPSPPYLLNAIAEEASPTPSPAPIPTPPEAPPSPVTPAPTPTPTPTPRNLKATPSPTPPATYSWQVSQLTEVPYCSYPTLGSTLCARPRSGANPTPKPLRIVAMEAQASSCTSLSISTPVRSAPNAAPTGPPYTVSIAFAATGFEIDRDTSWHSNDVGCVFGVTAQLESDPVIIQIVAGGSPYGVQMPFPDGTDFMNATIFLDSTFQTPSPSPSPPPSPSPSPSPGKTAQTTAQQEKHRCEAIFIWDQQKGAWQIFPFSPEIGPITIDKDAFMYASPPETCTAWVVLRPLKSPDQ